ncbi:MAG: GNAT family N-acetyltransferase [Pseudomonadota bacterium]|nr:GNAT family N-acetyltransferase [Pseudomonadota bacterium]
MNRPGDRSIQSDTRTAAARISLRRSTVADAEGFAAMLSNPEVYPQLLQMPFGSAEHWRARLTENAVPGKPDLLLVAVTGDGVIVGGAGLHPVGASPRRRHAMTLGMQVQPAWQRQGIGTQLLQALIDYADNWLGLLRLELEVYADNHKAQALYKRFGFVEEGLHRCDTLRGGVYVDSLSMARLNPAPLQGFPRD